MPYKTELQQDPCGTQGKHQEAHGQDSIQSPVFSELFEALQNQTDSFHVNTIQCSWHSPKRD